MMLTANLDDLTDVMTSVDEMKAAPLSDAERSEGEVGVAGRGAEDLFCLIERMVHGGQGIGDGRGQISHGGQRLRSMDRRRDDGGSFASAGQKAETEDNELDGFLQWGTGDVPGCDLGHAALHG